jgi:hypothetical protein
MTDHNASESGLTQTVLEQWAGAPARPGNKWWTLVAVCLGIFMLLLDITIVTVALPDIQRGLGSSFSGLQWIVDAYALMLAAFLLTAGSLSDIYGRRLLFLIGLIVFTGASLPRGRESPRGAAEWPRRAGRSSSAPRRGGCRRSQSS